MSDDIPRSPPRVESTPAASSPDTTRREFLKASAAVTGAALLPGCMGDASDSPAQPGGPAPQRFARHMVVMFENRSIDNLLGHLYAPGQVPRNQTYNGIAGTTYSNPVPPYINDGHTSVSTRISPGTDADYSNPNPDPGETYPHVNTQLFNIVNPASNEFLPTANMAFPYNAPAPGQTPTMDGFVHDYCNNFVANKQRMPSYEEYRIIMDGFSSSQLPVLSTLASGFAVYDTWHCGVPSQTFCNRSFFHASSSSGALVNEPYSKWLGNTAPTIFNRLEDAKIPWKVYFDSTQLISLTGLIHAPQLFTYWKTRFATMDTFYSDLANNTLPAYSFIEPRMLWLHNDMHPPAATFVIDKIPIGGTSDVRAGDLLLHNIYTAFKASQAADDTLMLVTFDEHGGTFDHVAPPAGTPPYNPQPSGEFNFLFDRLGVRVPAIAISAHTQSGTVFHRAINHAAMIRTLCLKYTLEHLTERDRNAADLSDAFNLADARAPSTWPTTVPLAVPAASLETDPLSPGSAPQPINDLSRNILGLAMAYFLGREPAAEEIPTTVGAGYTLLAQIARGAFGPG
ncbi:MAG: alkaline phosphatase family protein [Betaproteobacteria bacterium]